MLLVDGAMLKMFSFIENHEVCHFTFVELSDCLTGYKLDDKTIKPRYADMQKIYEDKLIITSKTMYSSIVC